MIKRKRKRKKNPSSDYLMVRISGYGPKDELVFVKGNEKRLREYKGCVFDDSHLDSILAFLIERYIAREGGDLMKKVLGSPDKYKKALTQYNNQDYDGSLYEMGYELSQFERTLNESAAEELFYRLSRI